jgi:cell division protein FtsZ
MPINLKAPKLKELKPHIMVCGVGGAGGNAVNNMIASGLSGVDFIVANTDAQALASSRAKRIIQMGLQVTEGLGAGARPERSARRQPRKRWRRFAITSPVHTWSSSPRAWAVAPAQAQP